MSVLDKTKSYKFVGGKFVERTAEELARLERLKAAQAARVPAKKAATERRMPRTEDYFVMVTDADREADRARHVCWPLLRSYCLRISATGASLSSCRPANSTP